jgi:hypothetical protein
LGRFLKEGADFVDACRDVGWARDTFYKLLKCGWVVVDHDGSGCGCAGRVIADLCMDYDGDCVILECRSFLIVLARKDAVVRMFKLNPRSRSVRNLVYVRLVDFRSDCSFEYELYPASRSVEEVAKYMSEIFDKECCGIGEAGGGGGNQEVEHVGGGV